MRIFSHSLSCLFNHAFFSRRTLSLKGQNRNRNNDNRLFDDQNNNRGGYNVGNMYYYEGSILSVEWTAQHSCGNANNKCEFVFQYMCENLVRDGTEETTIPANNANCLNNDCDTDPRYGRHESYGYYDNCIKRERNKGLFRGTQNLNNRNTARHTRQNAAGTRYGYECPEERDYYPYWGPSPWRDVAIFTNEPQRCAAYATESQNVKSRWYCKVPEIYWTLYPNAGQRPIPIAEDTCAAFTMVNPETQANETAVWTEVSAFNLPAPQCRQNLFTRDNHHGNAVGGQTYNFNWTIPAIPHERCVFRLRYNITTDDFPGFESATSIQSSYVNADLSGPIGGGGEAKVPIWEKFGVSQAEAKTRGYVLQGNPEVDMFGSLLTGAAAGKVKLQLNVNTAQFSRTFEDRSHRFAIRAREGNYPADATIYNLNVRGKRGNIVQTYPATEYDFAPSRLVASQGDYVHIQWTGSNANPQNNDGQGRAGTDRSNMVGLVRRKYTEAPENNRITTVGTLGTNIPKRLGVDLNFLGWSNETLVQLATLSAPGGQFGGDMTEFDDAGTYFDMAPRMLGRIGVFNYMCTRNNNFSNRSQKGAIIVSLDRISSEVIGWNGGEIQGKGRNKLMVPEGAFQSAQLLSLTVVPAHTLDSSRGESIADLSSDVVVLAGAVGASNMLGNMVKITIGHDASPLADTHITVADTLAGPWTRLATSVSSDTASAWTDRAGVYAVQSPLKVGAIIGIVIGGLILIAAGVFLIIYCKKKADAAATAAYSDSLNGPQNA